MKAIINKAPQIAGYIELNKKYGYGYQGRLVMENIIDSVIDAEPFTLDEAYSGMVFAIEEINKQEGYNYDPYKVIHLNGEAVQANRKHDFTSARVAKDISDGRGELAVPHQTDYKKEIINGEDEILLTGRGTLLTIFFSWRDDKMPKAKISLLKYCEYLAMHRYGKSATDIFQELESKDKDRGADWIKATYGKYVTNDADLISYVMNL